jgi:hypothetical protein
MNFTTILNFTSTITLSPDNSTLDELSREVSVFVSNLNDKTDTYKYKHVSSDLDIESENLIYLKFEGSSINPTSSNSHESAMESSSFASINLQKMLFTDKSFQDFKTVSISHSIKELKPKK